MRGWTDSARLVVSTLVVLVASAAGLLVAAPLQADPESAWTTGHGTKKGARDAEARPLLGTLVQTHTGECVMVDDAAPSQARFDDLLTDRTTGARTDLDPRLLDLLRRLLAGSPGSRIELVSGFRSPKLNEMLRKKGHHVESHSQHSLGHAVDFRFVPAGAGPGSEGPVADPRVMEKRLRAMGWTGGIGVYLAASDWFVHADVGKLRRWKN